MEIWAIITIVISFALFGVCICCFCYYYIKSLPDDLFFTDIEFTPLQIEEIRLSRQQEIENSLKTKINTMKKQLTVQRKKKTEILTKRDVMDKLEDRIDTFHSKGRSIYGVAWDQAGEDTVPLKELVAIPEAEMRAIAIEAKNIVTERKAEEERDLWELWNEDEEEEAALEAAAEARKTAREGSFGTSRTHQTVTSTAGIDVITARTLTSRARDATNKALFPQPLSHVHIDPRFADPTPPAIVTARRSSAFGGVIDSDSRPPVSEYIDEIRRLPMTGRAVGMGGSRGGGTEDDQWGSGRDGPWAGRRLDATPSSVAAAVTARSPAFREDWQRQVPVAPAGIRPPPRPPPPRSMVPAPRPMSLEPPFPAPSAPIARPRAPSPRGMLPPPRGVLPPPSSALPRPFFGQPPPPRLAPFVSRPPVDIANYGNSPSPALSIPSTSVGKAKPPPPLQPPPSQLLTSGNSGPSAVKSESSLGSVSSATKNTPAETAPLVIDAETARDTSLPVRRAAATSNNRPPAPSRAPPPSRGGSGPSRPPRSPARPPLFPTNTSGKAD